MLPAVTVEHRTDVDNAFPLSVIPPRFFQNNINPNIEHRAAIASRRGDNLSVKITYSAAVTAEHVKGVNTARAVSAMPQHLCLSEINPNIEHPTALTCCHGNNRSVTIMSNAAVTVEHRTDVDNAFPLSVIPPRFFQNNINPNIEHRAAIASRRGDNLSVKITYSVAVTAEHVEGVNTARTVSAIRQRLFVFGINSTIEHHTALTCRHGINRSVRIVSSAAVTAEKGETPRHRINDVCHTPTFIVTQKHSN